MGSLLSAASSNFALENIDTQREITKLCFSLTNLYKDQLKDAPLSAEQKIIALELASHAIINHFQGQDPSKNPGIYALLDYLSARGTKEVPIHLPSGSGSPLSHLGVDSITLPRDPDIFNALFGDGFDLYTSLLLNTISSNRQTNREKIQAQANAINKLGAFLKSLADDKGRIIIYPFRQSSYGLRNSKENDNFLPEQGEILSTEPHSSHYFVIDSADFTSFDNDFNILLGGLLIERQTFIIKTEDMDSSTIVCGFNLISGVVPIENLICLNSGDPMRSTYETPSLPKIGEDITLVQRIQLREAIANFYYNNLNFRHILPRAWISDCEGVNAITFSQIDF